MAEGIVTHFVMRRGEKVPVKLRRVSDAELAARQEAEIKRAFGDEDRRDGAADGGGAAE